MILHTHRHDGSAGGIVGAAADPRVLLRTGFLLAGTDIKIVSKRPGHARTAITRDLYHHVLDGLQDQAAERRAAPLAPGRSSVVTPGS